MRYAKISFMDKKEKIARVLANEFSNLRRNKLNVELLANTLEKIIDNSLDNHLDEAHALVARYRQRHPYLNADELAHALTRRAKYKGAITGALAGLPGGFVGVPAGIGHALYSLWRIESKLLTEIAVVYGADWDKDWLKTDIIILLGGSASKEILNELARTSVMNLSKKAIDRFITKEVMHRIWKVIPRKVISKAGEKSLIKIINLVPIIGGAVSGVIEYKYIDAIGMRAIKYYRGYRGVNK